MVLYDNCKDSENKLILVLNSDINKCPFFDHFDPKQSNKDN